MIATRKSRDVEPSWLNPARTLNSASPYRFLMWDFYESQLAVLAFFSAFFYGLDKKFSRKSNPKDRSDSLENGHLGHSDNVSTLARKYLTVYAIVMGKLNLINRPNPSNPHPQARTGSRAHMCTPCTTKNTDFQSGWLLYFL